MLRKKVHVKYRKERLLLSDVLPYELPLCFSNRHLYKFLQSHKITLEKGVISWDSSVALDEIIHIIFGLDKDADRTTSHADSRGRITKTYKLDQKRLARIPFAYKINHRQGEYRQLSIPHPFNQMQAVDFYHAHKETILHYCSTSHFSIRKPSRVARYKFHKDKTHYENLASDEPSIEQSNDEYENFKSFFVYKKYSNIYKFYESYEYHRCEKRFNKLTKLDISKCFDSIYTHSIAWAIYGKEFSKENLAILPESFPGKFDRLMQSNNYNETNGIIIGPEFSRIFAEILLQAVDKKVKGVLLNNKLINMKDYQIFRYVDDYFVFFNSDSHQEIIVETIQHALKEYKLHLNALKAITYEKPIITEITRAKDKISSLLNDALKYDLEVMAKDDLEEAVFHKGYIYINSKSLITQFKTIIRECNVEYKDMLNYSLTVIESRCDKILKNYSKAHPEHRSEKALVKAILSILEFVFFIYSVFPRVNTTIKLSRILRVFISFLSAKSISSDSRHLIFKYVHDDILFIINKNNSKEHAQVETLFLLVILGQLGGDYWIEESILAKHLKIEHDNGGYRCKHDLNYLSIIVTLFYIKDKVMYKNLRLCIEEMIVSRFKKKKGSLRQESELALLFFDVIACPFVSQSTKDSIFAIYDINDEALQTAISNFKDKSGEHHLRFTSWNDFDFGMELDAKLSQEVY